MKIPQNIHDLKPFQIKRREINQVETNGRKD